MCIIAVLSLCEPNLFDNATNMMFSTDVVCSIEFELKYGAGSAFSKINTLISIKSQSARRKKECLADNINLLRSLSQLLLHRIALLLNILLKCLKHSFKHFFNASFYIRINN